MAEEKPKDPRLRPYRIAAWVVYLVVTVGFSSLVIYSVASQALKRRITTNVSAQRPAAECSSLALGLFNELEQWRGGVSAQNEREDLLVQFRQGWQQRFADAKASCRVAEPVFDALDAVFVAYTIESAQYVGEAGPAVDAFRTALKVVSDGAK